MDQLTEKRFEGRASTEIAIASFGIGTVFFGANMIIPATTGLLVGGLIYVLVAILINTIVILNLLYHFIILPNQREYLAIKMLIVLANIPIALFYFYLTFNLF